MQTVFFEILIRLLGRFYPLPLLLAPLHREPSFVDDGLRVNNTRNIRKNTTKVARFFGKVGNNVSSTIQLESYCASRLLDGCSGSYRFLATITRLLSPPLLKNLFTLYDISIFSD